MRPFSRRTRQAGARGVAGCGGRACSWGWGSRVVLDSSRVMQSQDLRRVVRTIFWELTGVPNKKELQDLTETETRKVVARGRGGAGWGSYGLIGDRVSLLQDGTFLEMNGGDNLQKCKLYT